MLGFLFSAATIQGYKKNIRKQKKKHIKVNYTYLDVTNLLFSLMSSDPLFSVIYTNWFILDANIITEINHA